MSESEHRRDPRITRSFMVRYRAKDAQSLSWSLSPLRDLSGSGARFMCEGAFPVGTLLELQLLLPTMKQPVSLKALVAWAKPGPFDLAEHGVTFDETDPQIQRLIDIAVVFFLSKERRQ